MNILFFNRYRLKNLYGVERWMLRMIRELALRNHSVFLACRADTALRRAAGASGIFVWQFSGRRGGALMTVLRMRRFMRERKIDVVCVKTWKEVYMAALASSGMAVRLFCRRGNNGDIRDCLRHRLAVSLWRPRIIAPSAALAAEFASIPWMRGRPIYAVPHGVDMEEFRSTASQPGLPECRFRFVFVGRLSPVKGIDILLRAWQAVVARAPGARLMLVGGREKIDYAAMARNLGLADSVDFVGYRQNIKPWMAASQALVLPSRREGGGIVTLEAMALGLPVIGSDVGGIPEYVVDGLTGAIVPVGNVNALAAAMADMALHPERARIQGEAGRRRVEEEFTLSASAGMLERVFGGG